MWLSVFDTRLMPEIQINKRRKLKIRIPGKSTSNFIVLVEVTPMHERIWKTLDFTSKESEGYIWYLIKHDLSCCNKPNGRHRTCTRHLIHIKLEDGTNFYAKCHFKKAKANNGPTIQAFTFDLDRRIVQSG